MIVFVRLFILFLCFFGIFSCGSVKLAKPLKTGEHHIHTTLGGPLVTPGSANIPYPYLVVGYGYGLTDQVALHGSFHPVLLAILTGSGEIGVLYNLLRQPTHAINLMLGGIFFFAVNSNSTLFFPIFSTLISRSFNRWTPYSGLEFVYEFYTSKEPYLPYLYVPFVGIERNLTDRWAAAFELKWASTTPHSDYAIIHHPLAFGGDLGYLVPFMKVSYQW